MRRRTNEDKQRSIAALYQAIQMCGGQGRFAEKIGVKQNVVGNWQKRGVPAHYAQSIENVTAQRISREDIRPDLFGESQQ